MSKYVIVRSSDFDKSKFIFLQKNKIKNTFTMNNPNIPWFSSNFSDAVIFDNISDAKRFDWLSIGNPNIKSLAELGIDDIKSENEVDLKRNKKDKENKQTKLF